MNTKIIITGALPIDKMNVAKKLVEMNDNFSIARTFTSDINYKDKNTNYYIYYMSPEDINLAFKNNVVLYITTEDYISKGIVIDSWYNDNLFVTNIEDFNNISETKFDDDTIVIWLDTKTYENKSDKKKDILECKYLCEKLNKLNYLYFLDEDDNVIIDTIMQYLNASDEEKIAIINENN